MLRAIKTKNAKWIYDTEDRSLRCCGDTSRFSLRDMPNLEFMWQPTNGRYLSPGGYNGRYLSPGGYSCEYYWFDREREEALASLIDK